MPRLCCPDDPEMRAPLIEKPPTFLQNASKILKMAVPIGASYTFSLEVSIMGNLALLISQTHDDDAAIALFQTISNFVGMLMISPFFVMGFLVSERYGELDKAPVDQLDPKNPEDIRNKIAEVYRAGLLDSAFIIPIAMLPMGFSDPLLRALHQDPAVTAKASSFLKVFMWALPAIQIRFIAEQCMFGMQKTVPAMIMALTSFVIGIGLATWWGVTGGFGAEPIGLTGIAAGFVIENYLTASLFTLYIKFQKDFSDIPFLSTRGFSSKEIIKVAKNIIIMGMTIFIAMFNEMAMTLALSLMSGAQDKEKQAELSKAMQLPFALLIPITALGTTTSLLMRKEIGKKNYKEATRLARHSVCTTLLSVLFLCLPFIINPGLLEISNSSLTRFIAGGIIIDSVRYNFLQAIRASDKWALSTILNSLGLILGLGIAGTLTFSDHVGVEGFGEGYFAGMLISALLLGKMWLFTTSTIEKTKEQQSTNSSFWQDTTTFFTRCIPERKTDTEDLASIPVNLLLEGSLNI